MDTSLSKQESIHRTIINHSSIGGGGVVHLVVLQAICNRGGCLGDGDHIDEPLDIDGSDKNGI